MATDMATHTTATQLPQGDWTVDPVKSDLEFTARGMWGLAAVTGRFNRFSGEFSVSDTETRGELRIDAASLDTGHEKRDAHLRSTDFFGVETHPTITFTLLSIDPEAGSLTGELRIRENCVSIEAPVTIELDAASRPRLSSSFAVQRDRAGLGWSEHGMIRGTAKLYGDIVLIASPR